MLYHNQKSRYGRDTMVTRGDLHSIARLCPLTTSLLQLRQGLDHPLTGCVAIAIHDTHHAGITLRVGFHAAHCGTVHWVGILCYLQHRAPLYQPGGLCVRQRPEGYHTLIVDHITT